MPELEDKKTVSEQLKIQQLLKQPVNVWEPGGPVGVVIIECSIRPERTTKTGKIVEIGIARPFVSVVPYFQRRGKTPEQIFELVLKTTWMPRKKEALLKHKNEIIAQLGQVSHFASGGVSK